MRLYRYLRRCSRDQEIFEECIKSTNQFGGGDIFQLCPGLEIAGLSDMLREDTKRFVPRVSIAM